MKSKRGRTDQLPGGWTEEPRDIRVKARETADGLLYCLLVVKTGSAARGLELISFGEVNKLFARRRCFIFGVSGWRRETSEKPTKTAERHEGSHSEVKQRGRAAS